MNSEGKDQVFHLIFLKKRALVHFGSFNCAFLRASKHKKHSNNIN